MEHYTTIELAKLTIYKSRRTLLQALHNNQQKDEKKGEKKDKFLSSIWDAKYKFGKSWVFKKSAIDEILAKFK